MDISYGSMGSGVTVLNFPPESFADAAKLDWSGVARRVFIDPAKGLIALMSPSSAHEAHVDGVRDMVKAVGRAYGAGTLVGLGSTRWRRPGDPEYTGVEPDACYYLGEKALAWRQTPHAAREAFEAAHPPDLVVEVERSHGDAAKPDFYREIGVPEMWRLDVDKDGRVEAEILDLRAEDGPALLDASTVLPLCTPAFVQEALALASDGGIADLDALIREAQEAEAARDDPVPGLQKARQAELHGSSENHPHPLGAPLRGGWEP